MLNGLTRILFVAIIGLGLCEENAEGMAATPVTVFDLPANTPGLMPQKQTKRICGVGKECVHVAIVPGTAAHAEEEHNNYGIYFPADGTQPTTEEAGIYSCANVNDNNITDWYVRAFGGNYAVELSKGKVPTGEDSAPKMGFTAVPAPAHIITVDMMSANPPADFGRNFWRTFRNIANTAAGRELLYRILIEIRRIDTANGHRHCYASGTERADEMHLTITSAASTAFAKGDSITFNSVDADHTQLQNTLEQYYKFLKVGMLQMSLDNFIRESWRSKQITVELTTKAIEQHIVDAFNQAAWEAGDTYTKINQNLNTNIKDYYDGTLADPANAPNTYIPANPIGWTNSLATNDSPRQWMRNLNLREIYRFKQFVAANPQLVSNANYATDDLIKAMALSGTFWVVDTTGGQRARKAFSGMLVPNQAFGAATYHVHTCMHGFSSGNATNNVAYYFVPYGVMASDIPKNENYVVNKGFKVTHIKQKEAAEKSIDDDYFKKEHTEDNNTTISVLYEQNDYAIAKVNCKTKEDGTGSTLQALLEYTNNPIYAYGPNIATQTHLPNINVSSDHTDPVVPDDNTNFNADNERLFVIGFAAYPNSALDNSGIAVSTTLTNFGAGDNPIRSVRDDQNIKAPPNIQVRNNEYFSSLATFPGISGGPVLRCRLNNGNGQMKKCACIGTVFGAERKFTATNQLERFTNFTNKK